jgi:hypothetical protein
MRAKRGEENVLKAKDNVEYVGALEQVIPNVELKPLYHQLCAICHPSNASIEYFYDASEEGNLRLSPAKDKEAILIAICQEYPDALFYAFQVHCLLPFLTLRVLHKFQVHPPLKALRKVDWKQLKVGAEIEEALK